MKKFFLYAAIIGSILFISCGKYEEGPLVSFLPKKSRLVNTWEIEKILKGKSEIVIPDSLLRNTREYKNDGTVIFNNDNEGTIEGDWEFYDKKKYIITTIYQNDEMYKEKARILKLKNKELWLEIDYTTYVWELHFKAVN